MIIWKRYNSLTAKYIHANNNKSYGDGFLEVKITGQGNNYIVNLTDGYKYLKLKSVKSLDKAKELGEEWLNESLK